MAYEWNGMRKIPWEEVKDILRKNGNLAGYYYLYDDDTEGQIDASDSIVDIMDHHDRGGEFGEELERKEFILPDGKKILAPPIVDLSKLGCMDEFEYDMWHLLLEFFNLASRLTRKTIPTGILLRLYGVQYLASLKSPGSSSSSA